MIETGNSQAHVNRNGTPDHEKSRVHKAITSDNYHNHCNCLKSFKPVVYGINYYRYLIESACETLVNAIRVGRMGAGAIVSMRHDTTMGARAQARCDAHGNDSLPGAAIRCLGGATPIAYTYIPLMNPRNKKDFI
jgi:hypothetical protein